VLLLYAKRGIGLPPDVRHTNVSWLPLNRLIQHAVFSDTETEPEKKFIILLSFTELSWEEQQLLAEIRERKAQLLREIQVCYYLNLFSHWCFLFLWCLFFISHVTQTAWFQQFFSWKSVKWKRTAQITRSEANAPNPLPIPPSTCCIPIYQQPRLCQLLLQLSAGASSTSLSGWSATTAVLSGPLISTYARHWLLWEASSNSFLKGL